MSSVRKSPQSGQVIIEAVLLLTFIVGIWLWFSKTYKDQKWFVKMVEGPWESTSGMIEAGVWDSPEKARKMHPNRFDRFISLKETN